MNMTSAITINQLLSLPAIPETGFLFQDSTFSGVLSEQELAAIHGGSMSTFETATLLIGAAAVIVAGGGVLAAAGYGAAAVYTAAFGTGVAIGAAGGAVYAG